MRLTIFFSVTSAVDEGCWLSAVAEKARSHIETGAAVASRYIEEAGDKLEQRYSGADNPRQLDPKTKARCDKHNTYAFQTRDQCQHLEPKISYIAITISLSYDSPLQHQRDIL